MKRKRSCWRYSIYLRSERGFGDHGERSAKVVGEDPMELDEQVDDYKATVSGR
jgi:hypothetical protein